ncbi:ABC transporter ATP-binding protein [Maritimibacter sp. DP1N21-5]|uniref:ABC transporter ATP-binding protein n=1 Tax=Maritimibacter sp. DP1N21-5 TaxID=2836867 RepID=UPI001C49372B|nr:ABC transporter ATP-binding protein [Maritimibacter sp. DP1N21-5]MBV7407720.1 ABC transporter ATP-binding protein [Maritimibacter sp. DP1N21-5]
MASGVSVCLDIERKAFGGDLLMDGLHLFVREGEVVAIVGPSGVGKSTILRMIAGLDTDYEGMLRIGGKPAAEAPVPGFVFQDPRLLPWATSTQNLTLVSDSLTEKEAHKLLGEMGLGGYEDALPGELSGGMQRRVSLARALAVKPGLLILDEPFVSIDRKLARDLSALIARVIRAYQPTVILVSHDPEDAARLADRIVVLDGRPMEVVEDRRLDVARDLRDETWVREEAARMVGEE